MAHTARERATLLGSATADCAVGGGLFGATSEVPGLGASILDCTIIAFATALDVVVAPGCRDAFAAWRRAIATKQTYLGPDQSLYAAVRPDGRELFYFYLSPDEMRARLAEQGGDA